MGAEMTKDEALKLALEAMLNFPDDISDEMFEAIAAIKEALAQPEKEPLGWCDSKTGWIDFHRFKPLRKPSAPDAEWLPLYTSPPQRKPLTEREILDLLPDAQNGWTTAIYGKWVARAVERAHGIKE